jgi:hypothetical protein
MNERQRPPLVSFVRRRRVDDGASCRQEKQMLMSRTSNPSHWVAFGGAHSWFFPRVRASLAPVKVRRDEKANHTDRGGIAMLVFVAVAAVMFGMAAFYGYDWWGGGHFFL